MPLDRRAIKKCEIIIAHIIDDETVNIVRVSWD